MIFFCVFSLNVSFLIFVFSHSLSLLYHPSLLRPQPCHDLEGRCRLLEAAVPGHQPESWRVLANIVVDPENLSVCETLVDLLASLICLLSVLETSVDPHRLELLSLLGGAIPGFLDGKLDTWDKAERVLVIIVVLSREKT